MNLRLRNICGENDCEGIHLWKQTYWEQSHLHLKHQPCRSAVSICRLHLKCDGTRAENRLCLLAKRTSPFESAVVSVQLTTGSRGVRISGSNAGYTMFRGSVKSTGYPLHSPVSPSLHRPVRHRVPSHFNWTLPPASTCPHTLQFAHKMYPRI